MKLGKISRADWKYVPSQADPDFDPEHNKRVIEESIRKHDAKVKSIQWGLDQQVSERAQAAAMFLKNLDKGGASSDIEQYFGKQELLRLRGEQILYKLKSLQGNGKTQS